SLPLLPLPRTRMSNCSGWDMMFLDELLIIAQRIVVVGDANDHPARRGLQMCAPSLGALVRDAGTRLPCSPQSASRPFRQMNGACQTLLACPVVCALPLEGGDD